MAAHKLDGAGKGILEAEGLRKRFGQREVVQGVSVEVRQGETVGLLGPNGAGKTTTFYMLIGIIKPTAGIVRLNGQDIADWPLHERARVGLSYLPQESSIFKRLTVRQNLQMILEHTALNRKQQKERADELLSDFCITHIENTTAMHLSGGERRRLEIARCMIREPQFVLLDEPFAGIDPVAVGDIQGLIRQLSERGIGVLISDHNVRETLNICDRAYLVHQGQVILNGTPEQIVQDKQARNVYLGEDFSL